MVQVTYHSLSSPAETLSSVAFSTLNSHQLIFRIAKLKGTVSALLFQCEHMVSNPGFARIILYVCTLTLFVLSQHMHVGEDLCPSSLR